MLVLSRRKNDQIVFPNLGIRVHVVRIDGKTVRLGVEAPRDVPVLRHEIEEDWSKWNDYPAGKKPTKLSHALRNRLHAATLGLQLLHRKLEMGQAADAEPTIFKIFRELDSMEREVAKIQAPVEAEESTHLSALLVDDNANESELLAGYLRTFNFDVATASDGADALEYLAYHDEKPNVVLLDMNMPRMDGPTTVAGIRANPANAGLRIFAISGLSPQDAGVTVGPLGVDRWFQKPIKPDVLIGEINRELVSVPV